MSVRNDIFRLGQTVRNIGYTEEDLMNMLTLLPKRKIRILAMMRAVLIDNVSPNKDSYAEVFEVTPGTIGADFRFLKQLFFCLCCYYGKTREKFTGTHEELFELVELWRDGR